MYSLFKALSSLIIQGLAYFKALLETLEAMSIITPKKAMQLIY